MRISDWSSDVCSSDLSILLVLNNIEIHPSPHRTHHGVIQESCSFMLPAIHTLLDCRNLAGNCSIDSCDLAGHRLGGEELVGKIHHPLHIPEGLLGIKSRSFMIQHSSDIFVESLSLDWEIGGEHA